MNNQQVLKAGAITTGAVTSGLLAPEQARTFIRQTHDATPLGPLVRHEMRTAKTGNLDKIGIARRILRKKVENVDAMSNGAAPTFDPVTGQITGYRVQPNFSQIEYATTAGRIPWEISEETLRENIEGQNFESVVTNLMTAQLGVDLEDIYLNGDVATPYTDPDHDFLYINDGWIKQIANGGHVVNVDSDPMELDLYYKALQAIDAASFLANNIEQVGSPEVNVNFNDVDTTALQAAMPVLEQFKATGADTFQSITAEIQSFIVVVQGIDLFNAGQNVVSGLIRGLQSMEGQLIATAKRMADAVSRTVQTALDIHSPSRVMEGLGENATEGMIGGVEKPRGKLELASRRLGSAVVGGASEGIKNTPYDYSDLAVAKPDNNTYNYDQSSTTNNGSDGSKKVIVRIDKIIETVEVHNEGDEDRLAEKVVNRLADLIDEADENMGTEDEAV